MKAFVHEANEKGEPKCGKEYVTPEYKTLRNMERYYFHKLPPGRYVAEVFYNWDNRYGTADKTIVFENLNW